MTVKFPTMHPVYGLPMNFNVSDLPPSGTRVPVEFLTDVSQAIGWTTGLTLGLGTAYALAPSSLAALATGWGAARAGLAIGALYPSFGIAHFVTRQVRKFANVDYRIRRLEMGGDYEDSATAAMARFSAVRDMSSALGASRRFLGREALYLSR